MLAFIRYCTFTFFFLPYSVFAQFSYQITDKNLDKKAKKHADSLYKKMTIDEKIGQLYIIALYTNKDENHISSVRSLIEKEQVGGVILMQDDAKESIKLVNEFQQKSRIPLLFGIDAEWGLSQRLKDTHKFPWAIALGAIQNNFLVYEMAKKIAEDCKKIGIHWMFAPVVDVNTNPINPIIGNRSFGSDIQNVISKSSAYSKGLEHHGVLSCIKHFPGHGDTDKDSHLDLPVIDHSIERLKKIELAPFKRLIKEGIGSIMVAHLYVPALEKQKGVPSSISYDIITNLLKKDYNYNGLIITDALNMNAVSEKYPAGLLDLKAFRAGNDIMLFSQDVPKGKRLIKNALQNGKIPEKRLEESVKKILKTKYLLGLHRLKPISHENIKRELNNESHEQLSEKLYSHAITLIKDHGKLLPLKKDISYYYIPLEESSYHTFYQELSINKNVYLTEDFGNIPQNANVIIGIHKDNSTAYKPYKISEKSKKIIRQIAEKNKIILNIFASPYALRDLNIDKISTVIVSYENNIHSMKSTAKALQGKHDITGRLPVTVNENLTYGTGTDLFFSAF